MAAWATEDDLPYDQTPSDAGDSMEPMLTPPAGLDLFEARTFREFYDAADPATMRACGVAVETIGGATAVAASRFDVLGFNRVVGLGVASPADDAVIDGVIDFYRRVGAPRFFSPVSPYARPAGLVGRLESRGLYHHNNWVKLWRPLNPSGEAGFADERLRVDPVTPGDAPTVARILAASFDMPAPLGALLASVIGRPGWSWFIAHIDNEPAGAAAVYARAPLATLAIAGTLPGARGHGVQSALINRRLRAAAEAGCEFAMTETGEDTKRRDVPSYRNMLRHGFRVAYVRPNYALDLRTATLDGPSEPSTAGPA